MRPAVFTYTIRCSLRIARVEVERLLAEETAASVSLPQHHPLARYAFDGGPCGPIPEVVRISRFMWNGRGGTLAGLRAFARASRGCARFVLFDVAGVARGFEIRNGRLGEFVVSVTLAKRRTR